MNRYELTFFDGSMDEVDAKSIKEAKELGRKMNDCGVKKAILLDCEEIEENPLEDDDDDLASNPEDDDTDEDDLSEDDLSENPAVDDSDDDDFDDE